MEKRITIRLSEKLLECLMRDSKRTYESKSMLVRKILARHYELASLSH